MTKKIPETFFLIKKRLIILPLSINDFHIYAYTHASDHIDMLLRICTKGKKGEKKEKEINFLDNCSTHQTKK